MALADPLIRLDSDCASLTFEFRSPIDVLQCLRVSRRWRDDTQSWIEGVGFRMHCCPILFDGEEIDRVAYYKRYGRTGFQFEVASECRFSAAQRDTNPMVGRSTSIKRLGWCKEGPVQAGQYTVWVGEDEFKLCWQKRPLGSKPRSNYEGGRQNIMGLLFPLHRGVALCHLNAQGQLFTANSSSV